VERFDRRKSEIQHQCNRRLRWQLTALRDCLEGRSTTFRVRILLVSSFALITFAKQSKIELLAKQLDEDEGP